MLNSLKKDQWFWGIITHYAPLYVHVGLASFMVNLLGLAMPLFVMNVYDRIVPNSAFESLWVLTIGILLAVLLDFVLRNARAYFVDTAGRNADVLLLGRFMDTLMDTRLDAAPAASVGGLLAKVREFEYVREFLGSSTLITLLDFPFILIFMGLIFMLGGWLVLIPLCSIPIMLIFTLLVQWPFERSTRRQLQHSMKKNALLGEIAAGFETIRVTRLGAALTRRWDALVDKSAESTAQARFLGVLTAHSGMLINSVLSVALVVSGVYRIDAGHMSMGGLIACVILQGRCMAPLSSLVNIIGNLHRAILGLNSMRVLMELPRENPHIPHQNDLNDQDNNDSENPLFAYNASLSTLDGTILQKRALPVDIHFKNVSFRYPGQDALTLALSGINLHIKRGEHVGIIGHTGSGKSTLARLAAGLYLPTDGRALFGTVDMSRAPMHGIRQNMGVLPQQVVLFSGTIRSNICDAWPEDVPLTEDALLQLAELCGVMDFARLHPLGLDMPVGEHGTGLSGGQAQAVALARALAGEPETIILDEPTSNLDNISEAQLRERLKSYFTNKTLIVLTHRTSILHLVDRIIVMEQGRIIKDGPLHEVVKFL